MTALLADKVHEQDIGNYVGMVVWNAVTYIVGLVHALCQPVITVSSCTGKLAMKYGVTGHIYTLYMFHPSHSVVGVLSKQYLSS